MILMIYVIVCEGLRVFLLCHRQLCCIQRFVIWNAWFGILMFRIKISKRSRLASKADANQTWTSLRTLSKVSLKLYLCFFQFFGLQSGGKSKTMYCSTLRVNMIASYPPLLQPDEKNIKIYPKHLSKKRTPGPCLPTAYFQLL